MPTERRIALDVGDVCHYLHGGDRLEWVPTGLMMAAQPTKRRPWEGPLVDLVLGHHPQWRVTVEERRAMQTLSRSTVCSRGARLQQGMTGAMVQLGAAAGQRCDCVLLRCNGAIT